MKRDLSISFVQANLYGLYILLPAGVLAAIYLWRWGVPFIFLPEFSPLANLIVFIIACLAGIVGHEAIHAVTWLIAGRKSWRTIRVGVVWWALTPYAHCTEPLEITAYRLGGAMPGLLLGLAPCLGGLIFGSGWWFLFGLLFTCAAGGDAIVLWLIRQVPTGTLVEDHPSRVGCYIIEN